MVFKNLIQIEEDLVNERFQPRGRDCHGVHERIYEDLDSAPVSKGISQSAVMEWQ